MLNQALNKEYILVDVDVKSKEECLMKMAIVATELGICDDVNRTYEGFIERETECSTGFTDGIAIPHTRCGSVKKAAVMIVKTSTDLEWMSMDGKPINFVIGLLVPAAENAGLTHMELLSSISRSLVDDEFRRSIKNAESSEEIYAILKQIN